MAEPVDEEIRMKLRRLLAQPERGELLDDPRRLSELVRERLGVDRKREAGFLNAVLQEGVPNRLLTMSGASLSETMIDNYAKKVSEDIGLKEDIARAAIAAWADGLGLQVDAGYAGRGGPPPPVPTVAGDASRPAAVRVAAIALIAQGAIKLLVEFVAIIGVVNVITRVSFSPSQLAWIAFIHIVLVGISIGAIIVGVRAFMNTARARITGIGLCAIGALAYVYFSVNVISMISTRPAALTAMLPALVTDIAGVLILGGSVVCFALWRPAKRVTIPDSGLIRPPRPPI